MIAGMRRSMQISMAFARKALTTPLSRYSRLARIWVGIAYRCGLDHGPICIEADLLAQQVLEVRESEHRCLLGLREK
jgi:hypothetical protein